MINVISYLVGLWHCFNNDYLKFLQNAVDKIPVENDESNNFHQALFEKAKNMNPVILCR